MMEKLVPQPSEAHSEKRSDITTDTGTFARAKHQAAHVQ
jgi:hypothetical protein